MSFFSKLLGVDKAVEGVTHIASTGMSMWDMSKFTPQEQVAAFERLAKVTSSKETSISRRIIIWVLMGIIAYSFVLGTIWIAYDAPEKVTALIELVHALKIDWAFGGGIAFYFLTHVVSGVGRSK